jgi:hypothetical protein
MRNKIAVESLQDRFTIAAVLLLGHLSIAAESCIIAAKSFRNCFRIAAELLGNRYGIA